MNTTYAEKLKDPRWQKKRLEILNRDEWTCRYCGRTENTLHVHHLMYETKWINDGENEVKCEPWEADNRALLTLCENCHETYPSQQKDNEHELLKTLYAVIEPDHIFELMIFINASQNKNLDWIMKFPNRYENTIGDLLESITQGWTQFKKIRDKENE